MAIDQRSQDILNDVGASGEPVFVIRAQDRHSVGTLRDYMHRLNSDSHIELDMLNALDDVIQGFERWQLDNPGRVKTPDLPQPVIDVVKSEEE